MDPRSESAVFSKSIEKKGPSGRSRVTTSPAISTVEKMAASKVLIWRVEDPEKSRSGVSISTEPLSCPANPERRRTRPPFTPETLPTPPGRVRSILAKAISRPSNAGGSGRSMPSKKPASPDLMRLNSIAPLKFNEPRVRSRSGPLRMKSPVEIPPKSKGKVLNWKSSRPSRSSEPPVTLRPERSPKTPPLKIPKLPVGTERLIKGSLGRPPKSMVSPWKSKLRNGNSSITEVLRVKVP